MPLAWKDFVVSVSMSTPILSDSTGAISIARDPVKHELTKHIGVDAYFTWSQVQDGIVALQYVPSEFQLQISSRSLRLASIINFTSPNPVLSIHHEFKGVLDMY
jgi:NAD dependent epimerase/dehydratase family enzyme